MNDRITAGTPVRLDPEQTDKLLKRFNVPTIPQRVVYSPEPDDAVRAAEEFGYPVVLKAFTRELIHKSDIGGVRMFLHDDHQVSRAATEIQERVPDLIGFLLQTQAPGGHEVMIECSRRDGYGPVIQLGLGGGWAELADDISARVAPIDSQAAREMIEDLRGAPLLHGQHGARVAMIDGLVEMLVNLSRLMVETPEVVQLDINPAIAGAYEVVAVDTRAFWDDARGSDGLASAADTDGRAGVVGRLLAPGSIAIIGAMSGPDAPGRRLLETIESNGFTGDLFLVGTGVAGSPAPRSYPAVTALPSVPDLACIVGEPEDAAGTVRACGEFGVPVAIVYPHLDESQTAELRAAAEQTGIAVCGPGTAGVVHSAGTLHAGLAPVPRLPELPASGIAILTQSGAIGSWLLGQLTEAGIRPGAWIDTGREIDLNTGDFLHHLVDNPETRVIAVFLDKLADPGTFIDAARRVQAAGKSLLVYRAAAPTDNREQAAEERAFSAALRHVRAARAPDLQTLADATRALAWQPAPAGPGVGLASTSHGALRVLEAECRKRGLAPPALEPGTVERIRESDTPLDSVENPMWISAGLAREPGAVAEVADALLTDPSIDTLILTLSPNAELPVERVAAAIGRAARHAEKPVLICLLGPESDVAPIRSAFHAEQLPVFTTPERATTTLRALSTLRKDYAR